MSDDAVLLKKHDRLMSHGVDMLRERYGAVASGEIIAQARREFETLISAIPNIGGKDNTLTDTIEQMTSLLALYRVLKARGESVETIGSLVHAMAQHWIDQYPVLVRRLIGRFYMSRLMRQRTRQKAAVSQQREFPENFVFEVVEGEGDSFAWGINYTECGVVKFFHAQGADEFTPYMCVIDMLMFPAMGIEFHRTGTIANGCTHCDFRFG